MLFPILCGYWAIVIANNLGWKLTTINIRCKNFYNLTVTVPLLFWSQNREWCCRVHVAWHRCYHNKSDLASGEKYGHFTSVRSLFSFSFHPFPRNFSCQEFVRILSGWWKCLLTLLWDRKMWKRTRKLFSPRRTQWVKMANTANEKLALDSAKKTQFVLTRCSWNKSYYTTFPHLTNKSSFMICFRVSHFLLFNVYFH